MNKKDVEFITGLFDRLIKTVNSLRPSFPKGGFVSEENETRENCKEKPSPLFAKCEFAFHDNDKVITIRCCMKCGRELAELKLIEPGEFYICETCKNRNSEYSQTFEGKLHAIFEYLKACDKKVIPVSKDDITVLIHKILHAFNDETKKITSYKKWTDQDMIDFGLMAAHDDKKEVGILVRLLDRFKAKNP